MALTIADARSKISPEIVYFSQIFVIYVIIGTAIYNITFKGDDANLWVGLLCSCLGYILPAPTLKRIPPGGGDESSKKEYHDNQITG